jgi:hypothetical protein
MKITINFFQNFNVSNRLTSNYFSYICSVNQLKVQQMKKLILSICLVLGVTAQAQCYLHDRANEGSIYFTPYYGSSNTLGADIMLRAASVRFGAGASVLNDNTDRTTVFNGEEIAYKNFEWSIYGTVAYRLDNINIGAKLGSIKSDPSEYTGGTEVLPDSSRTLYGGYVGYFLANNIIINGGWDNLAQFNVGVSFGF